MSSNIGGLNTIQQNALCKRLNRGTFDQRALQAFIKSTEDPSLFALTPCAQSKLESNGLFTLLNSLPAEQRESYRTLDLSYSNIETLKGLAELLPNVTTVIMEHGHQLTSLEGIEEWEALEEIQMPKCSRISSLEPLAALKNLTILNASGCVNLGSLKGIEECGLRSLDLSKCSLLRSGEELASLDKLKELNLSGTQIEVDDAMSRLNDLNGKI